MNAGEGVVKEEMTGPVALVSNATASLTQAVPRDNTVQWSGNLDNLLDEIDAARRWSRPALTGAGKVPDGGSQADQGSDPVGWRDLLARKGCQTRFWAPCKLRVGSHALRPYLREWLCDGADRTLDTEACFASALGQGQSSESGYACPVPGHATMNHLPPLHSSDADFAEIRRHGGFYVDKTRFFRQLLAIPPNPLPGLDPFLLHRHQFFVRPRHFGKTLLINTLEAWSQGLPPGHDANPAGKTADLAVMPDGWTSPSWLWEGLDAEDWHGCMAGTR